MSGGGSCGVHLAEQVQRSDLCGLVLCCQLCGGAVVAVEVVRFGVGVDDGPFKAAALLLRFPLCQIENVDGAGLGIRAEHLLNLDLQALAAVKRGFDPVTLLPIHGNDGVAGNKTIMHGGDVPAVAGCQLVYFLASAVMGCAPFGSGCMFGMISRRLPG